jgi:anaerobic magnesium-protoporphyrin IX monomethyl ester cyclase
MNRYGNSKYLFAAHGSTIHHSRGCPSACHFCAFWINMADHKVGPNGEDQLVARWRTKSVAKTIEEIEYLQRDFGKKYFVFVDDTFNIDPKWCDAFADEVLRRGLKFRFYAFLRADLILRDEKLGVFEKLVRAGLIHAAIGVERQSDDELKGFHKGFQTENKIRKCMELLESKYPEIFRQTTFLVGLRNDTRDSILSQGDYAKSLRPDYAGFHPLTPVPGTSLWREALEKGWVNDDHFLDYDWSTPVMETDTLTLEEIDQALFDCSRRFVSVPWFIRGLVGRGDYTRRMYIWWLLVLGKMTVSDLLHFKNPAEVEAFRGLKQPDWYNS